MKPHLLLIDNYDSFTYNLVQAFLVLGAEVEVHRNDEITVAAALALAPSHLCISPGPGTPSDAGVSMDMIRAFAGRVPVLGVCLGHQSIVEVFGGKVVRAPASDAWQDLAHPPRRPHGVHGSAAGVRGRALPFADCRECVDAAGVGDQRPHVRGGDHGRAPSHADGRGACNSTPRASCRRMDRSCWATS